MRQRSSVRASRSPSPQPHHRARARRPNALRHDGRGSFHREADRFGDVVAREFGHERREFDRRDVRQRMKDRGMALDLRVDERPAAPYK